MAAGGSPCWQWQQHRCEVLGKPCVFPYTVLARCLYSMSHLGGTSQLHLPLHLNLLVFEDISFACLHHSAAPQTDLLADQKEIAEHVMLVDLGRNDVGKVGSD